MDWTEALDIVIDRTRHERYRALCADDRPDREAWRRRVVAQATGQPVASVRVQPAAPPITVDYGTAPAAGDCHC